MPLSDVGVIFVSKGFADFIRNMGKASAAIATMGNVTKNKLGAMSLMNDILAKQAQQAVKLATAHEKTAQAIQKTKTSQNQIAISANNARIAQANLLKSFNDVKQSADKVTISNNRAAVSLKRLDMIRDLNDAFLQGSISLEEYKTAADATNNSIQRLGNTASSSGDRLSNLSRSLQGIGNSLGNAFGGIFRTMSSGGNLGASIGAALGSVIPALGTAIGGITGYILGAIAGLGVGIVKGILGIAMTIGKTILSVGKKILSTIVGVIKNILSTVTDAIKGLFSTIFNLFTGGIFQGGWNNLGNTIVTSMFKFEALKQIIRKVVNEVSDLTKESTAGAAELQTYTARLNFLIASQVRFADSTISAADAMAIAVNETQNLLRWEQKLALTSPISIEDVHTTLSMGIAMGWNVTQAKDLTQSILNYTAATGLGSEISERIIYNFAQMRQQGKVTGTELRDLGRGAFMPVNKILEMMWENGYKASMSFQEFRDQASAGKVDVEGFFQAFEQYVGTYMPDAMEKMNYTIQAVINNIHDLFKTLLGWNIVGPVIKQFTEPLKRFVDMMGTDKVILGAQRIGIALGNMVSGMKAGVSAIIQSIGRLFGAAGIALPTVKNVVQAFVKLGLAMKAIGEAIAGWIDRVIRPFADRIGNLYGKKFESMRNDFFGWGANLVVSFAKGMLTAASTVLVAVIKGITRILTFWMSTHSPPRMLPNIGQWGTDTINEWLHGFTEADFSALDTMKSAVQDALSGLVGLGVISDEQSRSMFANLSVELIRAFDEFNRTGTITTDIFAQLRDLGGAFGQEVVELLDIELQLAMATERVTQAQKAYDDAVANSARLAGEVNRVTKEYNNLLRKGADKKFLKSKLNYVNAVEEEFGLSKKNEIAKKDELTLAEQQQKMLEDNAKLQRELVKQLTDLAQAQKEAVGGAADAAEEIEKLLGDIDLGFEVTPPWTDEDLQKWIKQAEDQFNKFLKDDLPTLWGDTWTKLFGAGSSFQQALTDLKTAFSGVTADLKTIWDEFAYNVGLPLSSALKGIWDQPTRKTVTSYGPLADNAPEGAVLNPDTGYYEVTTVTNDFVDKFLKTLNLFKTTIEQNKGIDDVLKNIGRYLLQKIATAMQDFASDPTVTSALAKGIDTVLNFIGDIISNNMPTLTMPGGDTLTAFGPPEPGALSKIATAFVKLFSSTISQAVDVLEKDGTLKEIGAQIGNGLWEGIKSVLFPDGWFVNLFGELDVDKNTGEVKKATGWWGLVDKVREFFTPDETKNSAKPIGADLASGIFLGLEEQLPLIDYSKIVSGTQDQLNNAYDAKSPAKTMYTVGNNLMNGIAEGIKERIPLIDWTTTLQNTLVYIKNYFEIFNNQPSLKFKAIGLNLADAIAVGISEGVDIALGPNGKITLAMQKIITATETEFDTKSPSRVFEDIGLMIMQGLEDGIVTGSAIIGKTLKGVLSKTNMTLNTDQERWGSGWIGSYGNSYTDGYSRNTSYYSRRGQEASSYYRSGMISSSPVNRTVSAKPVYGNTVNFGDVHINNGMDWAMFKAQVQRAIVEG